MLRAVVSVVHKRLFWCFQCLYRLIPFDLHVKCSSSPEAVADEGSSEVQGCPSFFINENRVTVAELTHGAELWSGDPCSCASGAHFLARLRGQFKVLDTCICFSSLSRRCPFWEEPLHMRKQDEFELFLCCNCLFNSFLQWEVYDHWFCLDNLYSK